MKPALDTVQNAPRLPSIKLRSKGLHRATQDRPATTLRISAAGVGFHAQTPRPWHPASPLFTELCFLKSSPPLSPHSLFRSAAGGRSSRSQPTPPTYLVTISAYFAGTREYQLGPFPPWIMCKCCLVLSLVADAGARQSWGCLFGRD